MIKKLVVLAGALVAILLLGIVGLFLYPRPVDHTPAWVFEGNAADLDYCELPILNGSGLMARDIPQGHTPGCGYDKFPQPILRDCTEPLSAGASDFRGLWQQVEGGRVGHVERIEQCGNRIVVTAGGLIHDLTTDGLLSGASNDVSPVAIGSGRFCIRSSATTKWNNGRLEFYAFGYGPHVVTRYFDENDIYSWDYPGFGTTKMKQICELPTGMR